MGILNEGGVDCFDFPSADGDHKRKMNNIAKRDFLYKNKWYIRYHEILLSVICFFTIIAISCFPRQAYLEKV